MYRVSNFIRTFAFALLAGIGVATLWANLAPSSYYDVIEWRLIDLSFPDGSGPMNQSLTLMRLISDLLMALFLFFLGKELWEALTLERGALHGRRAGVPLFAATGGMIGAAAGWLILSALFQTAQEATTFGGWAVPLGSDVVLGYLLGRLVFGAGHPALQVLLLITIFMDIAGMLLLGLAYPAGGLRLLWLALPLFASLGLWKMVCSKARPGATERHHRRALRLWPYIITGVISWVGVAAAGLPPALGLLPMIPAIPHSDHAFGLFAEAEEFLTDPLNRFAHLMVRPLMVVLFFFGLTQGGIDLLAFAPTTGITLGALWLGKPLGLLLGGVVLAPMLGFGLPTGLRRRDMVLIAGLCGIGFTLPALALHSALPGGAMQEAARLGLGTSLLAGPLMIMVARRWR